MKTQHSQKVWIAILLISLFVMQSISLWAQTQKEAKKEGNVKIRIEKLENGKRKVLEKTYKSTEVPSYFNKEEWKEIPLSRDPFNFSFEWDSDLDDTMAHAPNIFFQYKEDSLVFNESPIVKELDSLIAEDYKRRFGFRHELHRQPLDQLLHKHPMIDEDFHAHFRESLLPFARENQVLMLDTEVYKIKKVKIGKDRKAILILKKKEKKKNKKK